MWQLYWLRGLAMRTRVSKTAVLFLTLFFLRALSIHAVDIDALQEKIRRQEERLNDLQSRRNGANRTRENGYETGGDPFPLFVRDSAGWLRRWEAYYRDSDNGQPDIAVCPFIASVDSGDKKFGFIDSSGKIVIPPTYTQVLDTDPAGMTRVFNGEKMGCVDGNGKETIAPALRRIFRFASNGLAPVCSSPPEQFSYGVIDRDGNDVIPVLPVVHPAYECIGSFSGGLAYFKRADKYGFIDESGNVAIQPFFDQAGTFDRAGMAVIGTGGRYALVSREGKLMTEFRYDRIWGFRGGEELTLFRRNGNYGYLDRAGNEAIPPVFSRAGFFSANGLAPCELNGKYGYIDKTGEFVIQPKYEQVTHFTDKGVATVCLDGKFGAIDSRENTILPFVFATLRLDHWPAATIADRGSGTEYIDEHGETFDHIRIFKNGLTMKVRDGIGEYINKNGETVLRFEIRGDLRIVRNASGDLLFPSQEAVDRAMIRDGEKNGPDKQTARKGMRLTKNQTDTWIMQHPWLDRADQDALRREW